MKPVNSSNQVLIVGAGPSGLMAAAQLLRWGIRPRIIEANAGPTLQTRAIGVQARSMEIYRQMGLEKEVFARGIPAKYATIFTEHGRLGQLSMEHIGAGLSPYPYMFILPQDQNEVVLGNDLKRHGLEVEWNTALKEISNTNDGTNVTLATPSGLETAEYRYVIGADGPRSTVRQTLGIDFEGSTYEHKFFVADLKAEGELVDGSLNLFLSNKYFVLALFPLPGAKRFRLIGLLPDDLAQKENPTFEELHPKLLEMVGGRMQFNDVSWFSTYKVHHRVAARFQKGHCFLVGDAAHIHSPIGGQGMNTGLQDAYNLAWKLVLVLRGQANEHLLETYHDERRANASSLINTTDRAFSFLVSPNPFVAFARDWLLPRIAPGLLNTKFLQRKFFLTISQTALNYRKQPLSVGHTRGPVQAGDRFPWFIENGQDVFAKMTGTQFTLFALGDWSAHRSTLEAVRSELLEAVRSELLEVVCISNPSLEVYAQTGLKHGLYLVRPDGYIGLITKDVTGIHAYLSQTIGLTAATIRKAVASLQT
jgi:2-polyprenyl-6-methoxyphenol hydroxylase-like FAD-dependent oxidoreductase